MTKNEFEKAKELIKQKEELESFMFWCSGMREGFRFYPAAIICLKRRWYGAIESSEYKLSERLQKRIAEVVEEEITLINAEIEEL
ncbi:hypothetical protein LJC51_07460 [Lachnospiraceae bacterium OttesenSCG-928-J05]|nr:hypothetical protein [Lachnospiraceae bacterium OttesenSCG-928-J05]